MLGPVKVRDLGRPLLTSLEALVPQEHFYRRLEQALDLSFVRARVKDYYADSGRPSIDPVVFFKLQLVLYLEGLRSERQLMRLAADRLSARWYIGYGFDETLPDHSTLTRIRERYGLEIFRRFFDAVVEQCIEAGLVRGTELYIDATKVQANASLDSIKPRFAVDEHLRSLFDGTDDETPDDTPRHGDEKPTDEEQPAQEVEPHQLPADPPPGLAEQNASRHDWIAKGGEQERDAQHGSYRRVADFQMSTTDPDATLMRTRRGGALQLGYHDHYLTDGGRERIILSVLVTPSEVMENQVMLDLLWHTCFRWKLWHGLRRFRLRRLWRVNTEALMIAVAQNLKRLLKWHGRGGPPASGMASSLPLVGRNLSRAIRITVWMGVVSRRSRDHCRASRSMPTL